MSALGEKAENQSQTRHMEDGQSTKDSDILLAVTSLFKSDLVIWAENTGCVVVWAENTGCVVVWAENTGCVVSTFWLSHPQQTQAAQGEGTG